jgi:hypothetical protein
VNRHDSFLWRFAQCEVKQSRKHPESEPGRRYECRKA